MEECVYGGSELAAVLRKSKGEKKERERERYAFTLISIEGFPFNLIFWYCKVI